MSITGYIHANTTHTDKYCNCNRLLAASETGGPVKDGAFPTCTARPQLNILVSSQDMCSYIYIIFSRPRSPKWPGTSFKIVKFK